MLSANAIVELHDRKTRAWHQAAPAAEAASAGSESADEWLQAVARQHCANFDLWHIEDEARVPGATDADLAKVKRKIDRTNQLRNDLAEELDCILLRWLEPQQLPNANAPLNSESPGLMIDRLSILALKIYHTREETERTDAAPGHRERNRERLSILETQRNDLAGCLDSLWRETLAGTRQFKLYRQLKMYNDPSLNPEVYRKLAGHAPDSSSL
jgi:hypothetical protein